MSAQRPALSANPIQSFAEGWEACAELAPETAHTVDQLLAITGTEDCIEAEALLSQEEALMLERLGLKDIRSLSDFSQLMGLSLSVNYIEDATPLRSLGNNPVEEVSSLANLYALEELLLFNILVADVSPIEALAQLSPLDLYNTPIKETTAPANLLPYSCTTQPSSASCLGCDCFDSNLFIIFPPCLSCVSLTGQCLYRTEHLLKIHLCIGCSVFRNRVAALG